MTGYGAFDKKPRTTKAPVLDERKTCRCGRPFRCPTAQAERITCGPCK